jgi:predicted Fe-Mo cluster-binding NifX family protein
MEESKTEELKMEKIAVSAESPNLDDVLDPRFGRAAGFLIVNPETMECEYLDNGISQAMARGAGIQAAEIVANSGAKVVLTGYVGPKAFQALQAAGIKIVQNLMNLTARAAVERYTSGEIELATQPNTRGHGR